MQKVNSSSPTIMIFTEGTILGPKNFLGLYFHARYVPIGNCAEKIRLWKEQGAEIVYVTSRKSEKQVGEIRDLLDRYGFPESHLYYRERNQKYKDVVEKVMPDVLIEDDCRSIGGSWQWCITHVGMEQKEKITSIIVKEFRGIDHLPDLLTDLVADNNNKQEG